MPANRSQLNLRSASQEQFHRSRTQSKTLRRMETSQRTYGKPAAVSGKSLSSSLSKSSSSSSKSSSSSSSSSQVVNEVVDMENVNPQQRKSSSSRSLSKSAPTVPNSLPTSLASKAQAPLSFDEFKQLRRQSSRSTNYVPPMIPLERSGNSRHLVGDTGDANSSMMSFGEFKETRRATLNNEDKLQSNNKSTRSLSVDCTQHTNKKQSSFRKQSSTSQQQQQVKQYGTSPVPKTAVPKIAAQVLPKKHMKNKALTPIKEDGQHYSSTKQQQSSSKLLLLSPPKLYQHQVSYGSSDSEGSKISSANCSSISTNDNATPIKNEKSQDESYIITTTTTQHHDNNGINPSMSTLTEDDAMLTLNNNAHPNVKKVSSRTLSPPTKLLVKTIEDAILDTSAILDEALEDTMDTTTKVIGEAQHLLNVTATQSIVANEMIEYYDDDESVTTSEEEFGVLLPDGMPELLVIPTDWEELAGFIRAVTEQEEDAAKKKQDKKKQSGTRSSSIDTSDILPIKPIVVVETMDGEPEINAQEENDGEYQELGGDGGDDDPRNHSMWVGVPENEEMNEDDDEDVNNIVIGTLLEEDEEVQGRIGFESSNEGAIANSENEEDARKPEPLSPVWDPSPFSFNKGDTERSNRSSSFLDTLEGVTFHEDSGKVLILKEESAKKLGIDVRCSIDSATSGNEFQAVTNGAHFVGYPQAFQNSFDKSKPNDATSSSSALAKRQAGNEKSVKQRELKGRILLIRIKKKVSKVPKAMKKMLLLPFHKSRKNHHLSTTNGGGDEEIVTEVKVLITPRNNSAVGGEPLASPSSMSVISITSSIVSSNTNNNGTAIIGAVPVKSDIPPATAANNSLLYGAINYDGSRSCNTEEDSTVGGDELPPPPTPSMFLSALGNSGASSDEEDAVSFLAEAMRCAQSSNEDEDSVILVVAPKEDSGIDSEDLCQVVSSALDAQTPMLSAYNSVRSEDNAEEAEDDISFFEGTSPQQELARLFINDDSSPIQIMEAVEVEGGYLLTPTGGDSLNNDRANIFRCSSLLTPTGGESPNNDRVNIFHCSDEKILPGSIFGSDDDSENEDPIFHDGCTAIQQTSSFGDHTLDRIVATQIHPNLSVEVPTSEEALLPSSSSPSSKRVNIDSINSLLERFDQLRLSSNASSSPLICNSSKPTTPTNTTSAIGRKISPKGRNSGKQSPKTASKTRSINSRRGGLVKSRISDIQQRIEVASFSSAASSASASSDDASVYRSKHHRLSSSNNFIRTVPIGIAKSYSRDSDSYSCEDGIGGGENGGSNRNSTGGWSSLSHCDSFESNLNPEAYAQKYTQTLDM